MKKQSRLFKILIFIACNMISAVLAVCLAVALLRSGDDPNQRKLQEIAEYIDVYHVDNPDTQDIYDYAAAGMVQGTGDRWSYYISAADMQSYEESNANSYVGIGVTVQAREDGKGIDVLSITPGGPAAEAGVLPGDVIIEADGTDVQEATVTELSNLVKGEAGTSVEIKVRRGEATKTFTVTRKVVDVQVAVGKLLDGNVGYVKIANFNEKCYDETVAAIEDVIDQGAQYLVFDVRGNPGGYKDELVKILDYLLPKGDVFKSVYYDGSEEVDTSDDECLKMPMAVLINGNTYSAAEFFAAALEEYEWAITGGEPTVGKSHMQSTFELSDGSAVALSIAKYYTPDGICLEDVGGLTPQVHVPVDDETRALLESDLLEPEKDEQLQAIIAELTGKS